MTESAEAGKPDELPKPDDLAKPDELIVRIVKDPAHIPNLIVLVGLLGVNAVPADGKLRLYLTPTLNDYITFDPIDMVYRQPPPPGSPMAGSIVWLKSDATIQRTHIGTRQLQAQFLLGSIMDDAQTSMPDLPQQFGGPGNINLWTYVGCPPSVWRC
jgi:hypothetical protein